MGSASEFRPRHRFIRLNQLRSRWLTGPWLQRPTNEKKNYTNSYCDSSCWNLLSPGLFGEHKTLTDLGWAKLHFRRVFVFKRGWLSLQPVTSATASGIRGKSSIGLKFERTKSITQLLGVNIKKSRRINGKSPYLRKQQRSNTNSLLVQITNINIGIFACVIRFSVGTMHLWHLACINQHDFMCLLSQSYCTCRPGYRGPGLYVFFLCLLLVLLDCT